MKINKTLTPRFFQHWDRDLGLRKRVKIQAWQSLGKRPVQGLNVLVPGQNPHLERAINWVELKIETLQTSPSHFMGQIVEKANDGIITIGVDGEINYINRKLLELTGYSKEEALQKGPWEFVREDFVKIVLESIQRVFCGERMNPTEVVIIKKNGEELSAEFTASLLTAPSGKKAIGVVVRDISERKRSEAKAVGLQMRQREMESSASAIQGLLHALSQKFLALVAYADLVEMGALSAEAREDLTLLSETAEDIAQYFKMYKVFTIGLARGVSFALKPIVDQSVERVAGKFSNKLVGITANVSEKIDKVVLPPDIFTIIVEAVLTNAFEAVNEEGRVSLSISGEARKEKEGILVEITDNGRGMSSEEQVAIFRPFYSTKPDATALENGLPLALVQYMVFKLGGDIEVESRQGQGSTFKIWLPSSQAE